MRRLCVLLFALACTACVPIWYGMLGEHGWSISASMMVDTDLTPDCVVTGASGVEGYAHDSTGTVTGCRSSADDPDQQSCSVTTTFSFAGPRNLLDVSLFPDRRFVQFGASAFGEPMESEDAVILDAIARMARGIVTACGLSPADAEIRFFCSDIDAPCPGGEKAMPLAGS